VSKTPEPPKNAVIGRKVVKRQQIVVEPPPTPPPQVTKRVVIVHQHNWQWHIIARWFFAFVLSLVGMLLVRS
jgi:hypothetical protein